MDLSKIKIIFFDIDGTLLDGNRKYPSAAILETLAKLKERKILICLATGRAPWNLPHFEGVEADVFLTFNGSYCYHKERDIFSRSISSGDVKTIIKNAAALGRPAAIATKERIIANGKDQDLAGYYAAAKLSVRVADDFAEVLSHDPIYQIMLGCTEAEYAALMRNVRSAKITAWWERVVDIVPADSGKGTGVKKVLEYYHLSRSQALAFGDWDNDIEMFQAVGAGIAMTNASDRLKAVAADICGHVAEDGVYHYCQAQGLIGI